MAGFKVRRKLKGTGGARLGSSTNHTDVNAAGRMTMTGTARVRRSIWIPAERFIGTTGCLASNAGSMTSGSYLINITGSSFTTVHTSAMMSITLLKPSMNITGSPNVAFATFGVPTDNADGDLNVYFVWTDLDALETAGSVSVFGAAIGYIGTGSTVRYAASTGACCTYPTTTCGQWVTSDLGTLPAFGPSDAMGFLAIKFPDQTDAADVAGSGVGLAGVRIDYTACSLGVAVS